jgi:hypothetical protein
MAKDDRSGEVPSKSGIDVDRAKAEKKLMRKNARWLPKWIKQTLEDQIREHDDFHKRDPAWQRVESDPKYKACKRRMERVMAKLPTLKMLKRRDDLPAEIRAKLPTDMTWFDKIGHPLVMELNDRMMQIERRYGAQRGNPVEGADSHNQSVDGGNPSSNEQPGALASDHTTPEEKAVRVSGQKHSEDFTFVMWHGTEYRFALGVQSSAVQALWSEWEKSGLGLHQGTIRNAIDAERDNFRMDTAFRNHPAFGTMIQRCGDGKYKLGPPNSTPSKPTKKQSCRSAPESRPKRV